MSKAIQDYYAETYSHCYGCGRSNPHGHHLKSYAEAGAARAQFTVPAQYTGGVPDHVYGGMTASLFDCHGTASAAALAAEVQGQTLDEALAQARYVTGSLTVSFKRPVPIQTPLDLRATLLKHEGRKVWVDMTLHAGDTLCATAEMLAIRIENTATAVGNEKADR